MLNRTQISAGKTFTCKMAGTAKLFSVRTNVMMAPWIRLVRASGSSSQRSSAAPRSRGSASNWLGCVLAHAPVTKNNVTGHVNNTKTQMVPPGE